ncbi:MAG: iron-sulfur cluster assembly accessory protein [Geminicoccaceae bacterium]|nr:MAG: iron-sulfur cluster assembly accessory protein [Geminicoccaceae bacterium]
MLKLTEKARTAIRTVIAGAGAPAAFLRIVVESGGCAGLRYGMALDLDVEADDAVLTFDDVTVLVDPVSAPHLRGATVDFVNGLERTGFVFDNPNATAGCGCGKSFC